jgi:GWxTD domain-containing protein
MAVALRGPSRVWVRARIRARVRAWVVALSGLVVLGCSPRTHSGGTAGTRGGKGASPLPPNLGSAPDPTGFYRQLGMLAQGGSFPFVGQVRYLAGRSPDSTLALVTFSFANRALTFTGENGSQRASYVVTIDVTQGSATIRHFDVHKIIRVASFHETQREDESVIFQQFLSVPPGAYSISLSVRDENSGNGNTQQMAINVPRFSARTLSTPISIYEVKPRARLDTVPVLIANPRSLIVLGRDTLAGLYVEGYGLPATAKVNIAVLNDAQVVILRDTVNLIRQGELSSALLDFPVQSIGVGPVTVITSLAGTADTMRAPLFLSFGDEFGITSFDDLLSYLRYFVSPQRIQALRDTPPEQRAAAWAMFWRQTDPNPSTPDNEALRDYFKRIATANSRYREEGIAGWLTDRGKVYVTLGEPDQAGQPMGTGGATARSRAEIWVYTQYNLRLIFQNQGNGHLRLSPSSQSDFDKVVRRVQSQ